MQKVLQHAGVISSLLFITLIVSACSSRNEPYTPWTPSYPPVKADFTYQVQQPLTVALTNRSEYANSYRWSFGDGQTSTQENPVHRYKSKGVYKITLVAANSREQQTATSIVTVEEPTRIYISGFTINKIPYNGQYYYVKVIDDDFFTTTWVETSYDLLSAAIMPYSFYFYNPILLSGLSEDNYYITQLFYNTKKLGAGTKVGSWKMTKSQILQYPESLTGTSDNASVTTHFLYK